MDTETLEVETEVKNFDKQKVLTSEILVTIMTNGKRIKAPFEFFGKKESSSEEFLRGIRGIINFTGPKSRSKKKNSDLPRLDISSVVPALISAKIIYIGPTEIYRQYPELLKKFPGVETLIYSQEYFVVEVMSK